MILALVCIVMWAVFFGLLRLNEHVRSRHHSGSTRTDVLSFPHDWSDTNA
jgi:hypothetical protein